MDPIPRKVKKVWELPPRRRDMLPRLPPVETSEYRTPLYHGGDWARCVSSAMEGAFILTAIATNGPNELSGKVVVHDAKTGNFLGTLGKTTNDDEIAATISKTIAEAEAIHKQHKKPPGTHGRDVFALACYGSTVVTGDGLGLVATFDLKTRYCKSSVRVTNDEAISSLLVIKKVPDVEYGVEPVSWEREALIVGTMGGYYMIFDLVDGVLGKSRIKEKIHVGRIWSIVSYNDTVVTAGEDGKVIQWRIEGVKKWVTNLIPLYSWNENRPVRCVAVNRRWIATGSNNEVQLRKRRTSREKAQLSSPRVMSNLHVGQWVHFLGFMSEECLVTGGGDGKLTMSNLKNGRTVWRARSGLQGNGSAIWDAELLPLRKIAICGPWDDNSYVVDCSTYLQEREGSVASLFLGRGTVVWKKAKGINPLAGRSKRSAGDEAPVPEPENAISRNDADVNAKVGPQDTLTSVDILAQGGGAEAEEDGGGIEREPTGVSALTNEDSGSNEVANTAA